MSKHLPNCPRLSPYDGLGTAGINEIMRQREESYGREITITIETESSESEQCDPKNTPEFVYGYHTGYYDGYRDAVRDSSKTRYESVKMPYGDNHYVILEWEHKKILWKEERKR